MFISGQVGWDEQAKVVSNDFAAQVQKAFANLRLALAGAGAGPEHVTKVTSFIVVHDEAMLEPFGRSLGSCLATAYRRARSSAWSGWLATTSLSRSRRSQSFQRHCVARPTVDGRTGALNSLRRCQRTIQPLVPGGSTR